MTEISLKEEKVGFAAKEQKNLLFLGKKLFCDF